MTPGQHSQLLRTEAERLGFEFVGMAKAEMMNEEARRLEAWLLQKAHGEMSYMANHFDKRVDPTKLVPGAKSVVSLMYNYYTEAEQEDSEAPKISKYGIQAGHQRVNEIGPFDPGMGGWGKIRC